MSTIVILSLSFMRQFNLVSLYSFLPSFSQTNEDGKEDDTVGRTSSAGAERYYTVLS